MADDRPITLSVLAKFHREVILPDIERLIGNGVEGAERRLRDEIRTACDALTRRLDRLTLREQIRVLEERLDG